MQDRCGAVIAEVPRLAPTLFFLRIMDDKITNRFYEKFSEERGNRCRRLLFYVPNYLYLIFIKI